MARLFADGYDMYSTAADLVLGRWNTFNLSNNNLTLLSGAQTQFNAGQALSLSWIGSSLGAVFDTHTNEATVYFSIRFRKRGTSGPATDGTYLGFVDGAVTQCSILFASDNSIQVFSGDPSGTQLGLVTTAFAINTWDSYQGKVVINNSTGSVEIRKNGSSSPLISLSSVNTRGGSTNNYVNGINLVGYHNWWEYSDHDYDDLWFNNASGANPTSWPGDVRAVTLTTNTATQSQFSKAPNPVTIQHGTNTDFASNSTANLVRAMQMTPTTTGEVASFFVNLTQNVTGHARMGLYDASGINSGPGTLLLASNELTNPVAGLNTFTVPSGTSVARGSPYWIAWFSDATMNIIGYVGNAYMQLSRAYGSLPSSMAGFTSASDNGLDWIGMTVTPTNSGLVNDVLEDGDTTYVYSNTIGQEDIYSVTSLGGITPVTIHGVAPFVFWRRSDAGFRSGSLSVTANGSGDTPVIVDVIPSLTYVYSQTFMAVDPTSATWTASHINGMQIGVTCTG